MASTDITFSFGETIGFILEIPSQAYTGSLTDIQTETSSYTGVMVAEINLSAVQISSGGGSRRKVR